VSILVFGNYSASNIFAQTILPLQTIEQMNLPISQQLQKPENISNATIQQTDPPTLHQVQKTGILGTIWGSLGPDATEEDFHGPYYFLHTSSGEIFRLLIDEEIGKEAGGLVSLNKHTVIVTGTLDPETNTIEVQTIAEVDDVPPIGSHLTGTHVSGSQEWASILCRFGDSPGVTPQQPAFFENLMEFMDRYWQELSYNRIDLTGSDVFGWYDLPQPRANYFNADGSTNLAMLALDCANAADADVFFPNFDGINFMFNQDIGCCSWGGGWSLSNDAQTRFYDMTWMATWGWGNQGVLGQEMGHGFGLPHSSGPYSATYDSRWDVMSNAFGTCSNPNPDFGCEGVHTISFHKDALGWIDPLFRYVASTDPDQLIFIERLARPNPSGFLTAWIPIGGSTTDYYFIEARNEIGFDDEIPGEGIVIHKVDTTLGDRLAQVVDATNDNNPNDAGAIWTPGELFQDETNNISVGVVRETESGFWIIINPTSSNLEIKKSDSPDPIKEGSQLTYTISVTNNGPNNAENVQVIDRLPSEVSYVSDTGNCIENPVSTLTCDLGTITSGETKSFTISVDIPKNLVEDYKPVIITNSAEVSSDAFEINQDNNIILTDTKVDPIIADLKIKKSESSDPIKEGSQLTYTISVTNNGPDNAENVQVIDRLPSEVSYVSDTGNCIEMPIDTITCDLGTITSGETKSFTISVDIPKNLVYYKPVIITNSAEVSSDAFEINQDNNIILTDTKVVKKQHYYSDKYDGYKDYDDGYKDYDDGYKDYDDGYKDYDDGYKDYDDGYKDYDGDKEYK
jgi:uncharacterized repeat protein (TIGR01451 family)